MLWLPEVINMLLLPVTSLDYPVNRQREYSVILISFQILVTNLQENVRLLEGRIYHQI